MNFWKSWRSKFGTVHISRLKDYYEIASIHWNMKRWNFVNIALYLYTRTYTHTASKKTRLQAHILTHKRKLLIHDFNNDQISIQWMGIRRFDIWCFDIRRIDIRLISIQRDGIRRIGIRRIGILQTHIRWIGVWQIGIRRIGIRRISFLRIKDRQTAIHQNGRIPLARHQFHKIRKREQQVITFLISYSDQIRNGIDSIK